MTSDQRISLVIIIQLWVVFLRFVSSYFVLLVAILILLLIGLSWVLTSLSWIFTRSSLTQRSSHCWASVHLSGLTHDSTILNTNSVFMSIFCFYLIQLFQLLPLRYLSLPSLYSASAISIPPNLIRLLLSLFRIVLEGFTKTAICQGHRLHFAICCKIKLGEVVYLSLFGLPLPSTIFPFTSGLTCWERVRDGGRWPGWQPKLRWAFVLCVCLVVRLVGISLCHFYFFTASVVRWQIHKHTPPHCPIPTSFCSQYESLDSKYSSCRGVWGMVCYWVSSASSDRDLAK